MRLAKPTMQFSMTTEWTDLCTISDM